MTEASEVQTPGAAALPAVKPDQETLNIEAYERIYSKFFAAAKRIAPEGSPTELLKITDILFERYYNDQIELAKSKKLNATYVGAIEMISRLLERRGAYL